MISSVVASQFQQTYRKSVSNIAAERFVKQTQGNCINKCLLLSILPNCIFDCSKARIVLKLSIIIFPQNTLYFCIIIIQNMSSTVQCHYCGEQRDKNYLHGFIAKCCMKRCNKYFCIHCIRSQFNPEFEQNNYRKDTWICYFCQDSCNCLKCKNQELNEMERKNKRRTKNNYPKQNEESAEMHSASNFSLSNNMNSLSVNNPNITIQKVEMAAEVPEKPGRQEDQDIQKNIIPYVNIYQQMMISADDILLLPPYLKKIAQRKNMYYQFMMKQTKSKEEKSTKKIKQIISNELTRRKADTDRIDMEIE